MYKWPMIALGLLVPLSAGAGIPDHEVGILSPAAASCVDNGSEGVVYSGGQVGGESQPQLRDVPFEFIAISADGQDLQITFLTQWTEINNLGNEPVEVPRSETYDILLQFPEGETVIQTAAYPVPSFLIGDGENVTITMRSQHPDFGLAEDDVQFTLDRIYPRVIVAPEALGAASDVCDEDPANIAYVVQDNLTASNDLVVDERIERDGCRVRRIITVRDECGQGNAQEQEIVSVSPVEFGGDGDAISVNIIGYRCAHDGCNIRQGDDRAEEFNDGDRVARPTFVADISAATGCAVGIEAVIMEADRQVDVCPEPPPAVVAEPGAECVVDGDCTGDQICDNGICVEPEVCDEDDDCRGVRFCNQGTCDSPCQVMESGRALETAGTYVARVRVSDCGGAVVSDEMTVTVLEQPIARPGGNLENGDYEVAQGEALFLDGSTSFAPPEVGGVIRYAWDLNADGFFDADGEVFPGDEPTVPFDTSESGTFRVRLMVTAGNDVSSVVWFTVNVSDVDPTCAAGGPYEIAEGQALLLDGAESAAGHPTDPIVAFAWDFGDNRSPQRGARLDQPLHIYGDAQEEPYQVTLTVEDGDSSTSCFAEVRVIDVLPQLDGIEVLNPQAQIEGELVRFRVLAQAGSQADPLSNFAWTFGPQNARDEGPALRAAEWTYSDHGGFEICVTVSDEDSNVDICENIEIADLSPTPSFSGPAAGQQGEMLTFDAGATVAGGAADPLTQLVWDWGDGSALETVQPNQRVRSHTFVQDGDFTITLRAVDEDSAEIFQTNVSISDAEPIARVRAIYPSDERTIPEGASLLMDASESEPGSDTDPIVEFDWDFGDGSPVRTVAGNIQGIEHRWADEGVYEVRMTARDVDGSEHAALLVIEVTNVAPVVVLSTEDHQVAIGEPVRFETISGAPPAGEGARVYAIVEDVAGDLPPRSVEWDMGDGVTVPASVHEYVFNSLGRKVVQVTVSDGDGGESEAEIDLEVTPAAPTIQALAEQSVREGESLTFDVNILAPRLNPQEFDVIDVNILEEPPGATIEVIDEGDHKRVQLTWTPTYYDAGRHRLWIRANSSAAERMRVIDITVNEGGVPRIAAVGGTPSRGVLTFYDYERTQGGNGVALRSGREIELGLGTAGTHVDADGARVWVAIPGSNIVAVVSTAGAGTVIRRIPVGASPQGLTYGDGRIWVANHGDDSISAINPASMKVEFTIELDGERGPSDLAWLNAETPGVEEDRLVVVTDRSGHIVTIDPVAARSGIRPIEGSQQLGAMLSRVVVDNSTGDVFVADSKTRKVYRVDGASLAGEMLDVRGFDLDFSARDLLAHNGTLWVATGLNLVQIEGDELTAHDLIQARALSTVGEEAISGGAIAVATSNRIENYMADTLNRVTETGGSRIRRVVTLVAPR
jgi:DNA-binding beta-propeller fold protein YncE/PKD repeat protein